MNSFTSNFENASNFVKFGVVVSAMLMSLLFCYVILRGVYGKPTWQSLAVDALNPNTQVVVLGSSRVQFDIDPDRYGLALVGLPANYMNAMQMEKIWDKHQNKIPNVKLVILEMDAVTLFYDTLRISPAATARLGLMPWPEGREWMSAPSHLARRLLWPFFLWRLTPKAYTFFMADYESQYEPKAAKPGYIPSQVTLAFPEEAVARELPRESQNVALGRHGILEANQKALTRLIEKINARKISVMLLRFPKHAALLRVFPLAWNKATTSVVNSLIPAQSPKADRRFVDFSVLDSLWCETEFRTRDVSRAKRGISTYQALSAEILPRCARQDTSLALSRQRLDKAAFETADFRDPDHLNSRGAAKFAAFLGPEIERSLKAR